MVKKKEKTFASRLVQRLNPLTLLKHASTESLIPALILKKPKSSYGIVTFKSIEP